MWNDDWPDWESLDYVAMEAYGMDAVDHLAAIPHRTGPIGDGAGSGSITAQDSSVSS